MRICHVVTGLNTGGAEVMMRKLIMATTGPEVTHSVISLIGHGPVGESLMADGIAVASAGMRRGAVLPRGFGRLVSLLREAEPDIVQTWMYHANLLGGAAARRAGLRRVVWNIRAAHLRPGSEKRRSILIARGSGRVAPLLCQRIVTNSEEARRVHEALGYPAWMFAVIPNGFDLGAFRPDPAARAAVRADLAVPPGARLIGMIARLHPGKEHRTFLAGAGRLAAQRPDVHFVLAGDGVAYEEPALARWIADAGLAGRVHLLGRRSDLPRQYAALDVCTLTSAYESFPNVLGEAMACGVPCVTTDVGDAATIVGGTGVVIPVRDADALVGAWMALLDEPPDGRARRGELARARIEERYALGAVAESYLELYRELMAEHGTVSRRRGRAARDAGMAD